MKQRQSIFSFNRGLISEFALAREDVKRVALGATTMINCIARVLGSMCFRQGWKYLGATASNAAARFIPFIFSTTDTALIEFTNATMRVWVNDVLITRISVTTTIPNGNPFVAAGWTNADEAGASSGITAGGVLQQISQGSGSAIIYRLITVAAGDANKEHAIRIKVNKGFVQLRIGATLHSDSYVTETSLGVGYHSIAFTPAADFYLEFKCSTQYITETAYCYIESAGVMSLTTPFLTANLSNIRYDQSADIIFLADGAHQQQKIERRGIHSWSIVNYQPLDGPFKIQNLGPITITPSALKGSGVTLTTSKPYWNLSHIGALFSITSVGQIVTINGTALNDATNPIRVTGVGVTRSLAIVLSGFFDGTRTFILEYSFDATTWTAVAGKSWTAAVSTSYTDGFDNQVIYYRLKISVLGGAGITTMTLSIPTGSIRGIAHITDYTSNTIVSAEIITSLGGTSATTNWQEGCWSDYRGWPSSVRFHDGRLWWFGKSGIYGSVSDGYTSFDETIVGDSAPINRTIGTGAVDTINWAVSGYELDIGAQGSEISVRSSALGEPITPTNFNMRCVSGQGSAAVDPVKIDSTGVFVQRGGVKVYQLSAYNPYQPAQPPIDLTALVPELGYPGIIRMAIQRQPDTRIHCVRSDGTVMLGIFDTIENVLCWSNINASEGAYIEDVCVLPGINGSTEDQVYYVVKRTVSGGTVRYLEKWALETECRGGTLNKQADSFITYSGAATTTITGLSHLEGKQVIVWGDGVDLSPDVGVVQTTYTVTGGQITLGTAVSNAVVGLPYTGQWLSTKLGDTVNGTVLKAKKNMSGLGLVLAYVHPKGLQYGSDFGQLFDMPSVEQGAVIDPNTVRSAYDEQSFFLDGGWTTDLRLALQFKAPRPCTVLACVCDSDISI